MVWNLLDTVVVLVGGRGSRGIYNIDNNSPIYHLVVLIFLSTLRCGCDAVGHTLEFCLTSSRSLASYIN